MVLVARTDGSADVDFFPADSIQSPIKPMPAFYYLMIWLVVINVDPTQRVQLQRKNVAPPDSTKFFNCNAKFSKPQFKRKSAQSHMNYAWQRTPQLKETDEQRLLYHLMRYYERAVRPVRNASSSIVVKLGLTLTNIFDMEWNDELLRWNPKDFGAIDTFRIPCDLIWLPDIVLYNNADDYTTGYMRSRAMVYFDGTVFWPPPTQLRSTCKIDVTYFPFDSQRCYLKFGSWTYHGFQVDVTNRSTNVDLTNFVVSGEFDLVSVHQKRRVVKYTCCPEPYPDMTFFIHLRRKTLYYMYNVVFPCMMMSALTLLVFCLPPDSGEKIALGITVLLAFSVFVLAIAEKMPETSDNMPLIGIYLTVVMGMTSVSVVMTVMVLNFHHRGPFHKEIPYWVRWFVLDRLRRFLCMHLPYNQRQPKRSTSLMRRLSMKLTLDSLQAQLTGESPGDVRTVRVYANENRDDHSSLTNCATAAIPLVPTASRRSQSSPLYDEVVRTLQTLSSRQEHDDECEEIANEWRQVAQVIDRLLFWVFLLATILITLILLIIIPLVRHAQESYDLNEAEYGLT